VADARLMFDGVGRPARLLLVGGTSEIGLATLHHLGLPPDATALLAGRDEAALRAAAATLPCRGEPLAFDATVPELRRAAVDRAFSGGDLDLLLSAFGVLGDQQRADRDPAYAEDLLEVNLVAHAGVLLDAARRFAEQGHGLLVVFSSIAAVRARRANYVYGAAKAGLDALANGLRDRLHGSGVRLLLVRPGFVIGRMTRGLPPAPLSRTPDQVGGRVARAIRQGAEGTVWVPPQLAVLAAAIRLAPRPLWRHAPR
jgi:decaprenylphospho-beta-D-erythro-pentofuranosid-2-ulose 2-reductase